MGFPQPGAGSVTEDTAVTSGNLTASGDVDVVTLKGGFDQTTAWTAGTYTGAYGDLTIDTAGVWSYAALNSQPAIQALNTGGTLSEVFTVTSVFGDTTISITINGLDEPPCFVRGTMINTPQGQRPIETLKTGDSVLTADAGVQVIRWIGSKAVSPSTVDDYDRVRPVRILKDCFGPGVPDRDLLVSPMHRVLISGAEPMLLFGQQEVLCAAKLLINGQTILRDPAPQVEYFHMLFDSHQVIEANACPAESFLPGKIGLSNFDREAQEEVYGLFPDLRSLPESFGPAARRVLRSYEAGLLDDQYLAPATFLDRVIRAA